MKLRKKITIVLCLFLLIVSIGIMTFAQKDTDNASKMSISAHVSEYFNIQKSKLGVRTFDLGDLIAVILLDFPLSYFCLWMMLWLFKGMSDISIKKFFLFLVVFNLSRFMFFVFFKGLWWVLYFFVIRLDPSLKPIIAEYFFIPFFGSMVLIYVWTVARVFNLDFIETVKISLATHLAYLLIVFLATYFINFNSNQYLKVINKNIGLAPIVQTHIIDAAKIVERKSLISLIEFRPFHI